MNYRFLALLLLVGAAAWAAHSALVQPPPGANVAEEGTRAAAALEPVTKGVSKVTHTIGRGGSKLAGPAVVGMTRRTEAMLAKHQPAIQKAPAQRRLRAEKAAARALAMNKAAVAHLGAGEPIKAFRTAMEARSLVDVVRQQVLEETIR